MTRTSFPRTSSNLPSVMPFAPATRVTYSRFDDIAAPGGGVAAPAPAGAASMAPSAIAAALTRIPLIPPSLFAHHGGERQATTVDKETAPRRVAAMLAAGVSSLEELFDAVTAEAGALSGADLAVMVQHEPDGTATGLATWAVEGEPPALPPGWPIA